MVRLLTAVALVVAMVLSESEVLVLVLACLFGFGVSWRNV
jgi:hypothetical protein